MLGCISQKGMGIFFKMKIQNFLKHFFSIGSKNLGLKTWRPWQYKNYLCVKWGKSSENMDCFVTCVAYGKEI